MPRVIPFPTQAQGHTRQVEEPPVTRVTDAPEELLAAFGPIYSVPEDPRPSAVFDLLEGVARWCMEYRERHELPEARYFVVACSACHSPYMVQAGMRGGSWKGGCYCGARADKKPKPEELYEVTRVAET